MAQRLTGGRTIARILIAALLASIVYFILAYLVLPAVWTHDEHQRALAGRDMLTRTGQGIPGDPLNVGLVGDRDDVVRAMHAAGWFAADPVTLKTGLAIVGSVILDRPYRDAPVSPLFFDGRREDLAYEKPAGTSAQRRHHVRLWRVLDRGAEGRPVWLGAATFDRGVGFSHYTGQVTHHIAPDIDAERDLLISDIAAAGMVQALYQVTGIGPTFTGRNGGGDPYRTDGEIRIARLMQDGRKNPEPPLVLDPPAAVQWKDMLFARAQRLLSSP